MPSARTDEGFGNELAKIMKERGVKSVLDLGCGKGHYIKQLATALGDGKRYKSKNQKCNSLQDFFYFLPLKASIYFTCNVV